MQEVGTIIEKEIEKEKEKEKERDNTKKHKIENVEILGLNSENYITINGITCGSWIHTSL